MQFIFYMVIFFVGVSIIATFVQNLVHPPVEIDASKLPDVIQTELSTYFPQFRPRKILFLSSRHRYTLEGTIAESPARLEFDLTPDNELAEVDFKANSGPIAFVGKTKIAPATIPVHLADIMATYLERNVAEHDRCRAYSGRIGSENAFEIKIRSGDWKYEFEITQSGRVVEFEKETIRF